MKHLRLRALALLIVWLLGIEIILRIFGVHPAEEYLTSDSPPFQFDSTLGWVSKPGSYFLVPESRSDLGAHRVTIKQDNSRWTGRERVQTSPNIPSPWCMPTR